jgi:hypothetical protein
MDTTVAFRVREQEPAGLVVRVNFGVLTGRQVTPAEIDDLARALRKVVPSFEVVSEGRHEFGDGREVSVHQIVIEVSDGGDDVAMDVVGQAEKWARACYQARHIDL